MIPPHLPSPAYFASSTADASAGERNDRGGPYEFAPRTPSRIFSSVRSASSWPCIERLRFRVGPDNWSISLTCAGRREDVKQILQQSLASTLDPVGPTREFAQIAAVRSDDVCSNAL